MLEFKEFSENNSANSGEKNGPNMPININSYQLPNENSDSGQNQMEPTTLSSQIPMHLAQNEL